MAVNIKCVQGCLVLGFLVASVLPADFDYLRIRGGYVTEDNADDYFPWAFREAEDQKELEQIIASRRRPVEVRGPSVPNCASNCSASTFEAVALAGFVVHGCCESSLGYITPTTYPDCYGVVRNILQFDDPKQYFPYNECMQIDGCTSCTCTQEPFLVTAVVIKSGATPPYELDDLEVREFCLDGCCMCISF